jgi:hypothetical protein
MSLRTDSALAKAQVMTIADRSNWLRRLRDIVSSRPRSLVVSIFERSFVPIIIVSAMLITALSPFYVP